MNNTPYPLVYIIIVNWNGWLDTLTCLESLCHVTYPNYKLLIVDNGSSNDSIMQLYHAYPDLNLLETGENLGFTGANNIGISYAMKHHADYIMLLNNDTVVAPDFIQPLVHLAQSHPHVGAVTPKIYFMHDKQKIWAVGGEVQWWWGPLRSRGQNQIDKGQFDESEIIDYATGCCLLMPKKSIERVGLLDDRYFAYCEDADWCMRAAETGLNIWYEPKSKVWHVAGASSRHNNHSREGQTNPYVYFLNVRNTYWFMKRHFKGIRYVTASSMYFFRYVSFYTLAFIFLRRWQKLNNLWKGFFVGLLQNR